MNPSLEELRESYFIALSKLSNEEDIRNSLPLSSSDSFEELKRLLEANTEVIIKEAILDAMELYFPEDYSKWIKKKEV